MTTVSDPFDPAAVPEPDSRKAPEEEPVQAESGSSYIVFRAYTEGENGKLVPVPASAYLEGEVWQNVGSYVANNGNAAIRKAIRAQWSDEDGNPKVEADGHYATSPARSWGPLPINVVQPPASIRIGS